MYEKNRGRSKISSANGDKGRIDAKKSDAVCVWWEKKCSLRAAAAQSND